MFPKPISVIPACSLAVTYIDGPRWEESATPGQYKLIAYATINVTNVFTPNTLKFQIYRTTPTADWLDVSTETISVGTTAIVFQYNNVYTTNILNFSQVRFLPVTDAGIEGVPAGVSSISI